MNDDTGVSTAVFALKPEWADLILSGTKTVEIRRSRMKRMIDRMLIYRTGTGLIVGEARVKGMHAAPPEIIWRGVRHRIPHPEKPVRRVCERRRQAVRIPFGKPHPLREAEDFVRHRTETGTPIMVLPARNGPAVREPVSDHPAEARRLLTAAADQWELHRSTTRDNGMAARDISRMFGGLLACIDEYGRGERA